MGLWVRHVFGHLNTDTRSKPTGSTLNVRIPEMPGSAEDIESHRIETPGLAFMYNPTERGAPQNAGPGVSGDTKFDRIQSVGAMGSA